jgi:hypothetical protein
VGNTYGPGWGIIMALPGERFWPRVGNPFGPGWGMIMAPHGESFWTWVGNTSGPRQFWESSRRGKAEANILIVVWMFQR